jgi:hypothetical protein
MADITGPGINEAEQCGLVSEEKDRLNYSVRFQILEQPADNLELDGYVNRDEMRFEVEPEHSGI